MMKLLVLSVSNSYPNIQLFDFLKDISILQIFIRFKDATLNKEVCKMSSFEFAFEIILR